MGSRAAAFFAGQTAAAVAEEAKRLVGEIFLGSAQRFHRIHMTAHLAVEEALVQMFQRQAAGIGHGVEQGLDAQHPAVRALEKAVQKYLFDHLWLLDPSWERADSSEYMEKTVTKALGLDSDKLTPDERTGRLDLGYRQTAGKHVIIELKRAGRIVTLPEIIEQVMKYDSAIRKVLIDANRESVFDIIVVLGKPVDNDNTTLHRERVAEALKAFHARVVYYTELINNAYEAYSDFLEQRRKAQPLIDILDQLTTEE